jgi:hypothetical protein
MMLDPRKWEYIDRARLLIAVVFGALLGFTNGYSHGWFSLLVALIGAVVVGGAFYCYRAFR